MGGSTYEEKTASAALETFEWDNVWFEHTENSDAKRILYIGDSISVGTRGWVTSLSGEEILCDGFATSKALDNPFFKPSLEIFMAQESRFDGILINNGLHGWHLSDGEYEKNYEEMLCFLSEKGKPIYVLLTTMLPADAERDKIVCRRNEIASSLAAKYGISVVDLYSVTKKHREFYTGDSVHLEQDGYKLLAERILEAVRNYQAGGQ